MIIIKYFEYLRIIFKLFIRIKIILKFKKSYLKYFFITLLKKKINKFKFIIIKKRVVIIKKL